MCFAAIEFYKGWHTNSGRLPPGMEKHPCETWNYNFTTERLRWVEIGICECILAVANWKWSLMAAGMTSGCPRFSRHFFLPQCPLHLMSIKPFEVKRPNLLLLVSVIHLWLCLMYKQLYSFSKLDKRFLIFINCSVKNRVIATTSPTSADLAHNRYFTHTDKKKQTADQGCTEASSSSLLPSKTLELNRGKHRQLNMEHESVAVYFSCRFIMISCACLRKRGRL
jgi:hypothetical protein